MTEGKCELCGEDMPEGEKMFRFHGYSGSCPKPPLPAPVQPPAASPVPSSDPQTWDCPRCGRVVERDSAHLHYCREGVVPPSSDDAEFKEKLHRFAVEVINTCIACERNAGSTEMAERVGLRDAARSEVLRLYRDRK